jgi:hypothetical protein
MGVAILPETEIQRAKNGEVMSYLRKRKADSSHKRRAMEKSASLRSE